MRSPTSNDGATFETSIATVTSIRPHAMQTAPDPTKPVATLWIQQYKPDRLCQLMYDASSPSGIRTSERSSLVTLLG